MKTAGIVSAGLRVLSKTPVVHAAGSDIVKIGLVGCGGRGIGSLLDRFKAGDAVKVVAIAKGKTIFPYDVELTFDTIPPVMPGPDGTYEHAVAVPGEYDPFDKT